MRLYEDATGLKTYKTQNTATARMKSAESELEHEFRWVMSVTPEGRFHPVVILSDAEMGEYLQALLHRGICMTN